MEAKEDEDVLDVPKTGEILYRLNG